MDNKKNFAFIYGVLLLAVWETKFLEHLPENRCSLYVLYKIPLAQGNFLLAQLKMHSHWQALVSLTVLVRVLLMGIIQ